MELIPFLIIGLGVALVAVVAYDTHKRKSRKWGENYE